MINFQEHANFIWSVGKKAKNSSLENFKYPFDNAFLNIVLDRMAQNENFFNKRSRLFLMPAKSNSMLMSVYLML